MAGRVRLGRGLLVVACTLGLALSGLAPSPRAEATGIRYLDEVFGSYSVTHGLVYGQSVDRAGHLEHHRLDVLQPDGDRARTRAAVIWVHGGNLTRGSRDEPGYQAAREAFVKAGYVTFSIDYTLNPSLPEPPAAVVAAGQVQAYLDSLHDAQHDAQAAVRWVRAHAAEYRLDLSRIAIAGHSAGAVVAQMVGYNEHDPGTNGTPRQSSRVDAIVSSSGLSVPGVLVQVDLGEPPLLDVRGLADTTVPAGPGLSSCALTLLLGNVCDQILDPTQGHAAFDYPGWRSFLYRRMIAPSSMDPHTYVEVVET